MYVTSRHKMYTVGRRPGRSAVLLSNRGTPHLVRIVTPLTRNTPRLMIHVRYCHKIGVVSNWKDADRSRRAQTCMWTIEPNDSECWADWEDESKTVYVEPFESVCVLFDLEDDGSIPSAVVGVVNKHFYQDVFRASASLFASASGDRRGSNTSTATRRVVPRTHDDAESLRDKPDIVVTHMKHSHSHKLQCRFGSIGDMLATYYATHPDSKRHIMPVPQGSKRQ